MKNELLFTKSHEWILFSDATTAKVGITDHAQHALGDLVYVGLPQAGTAVEKRQSIVELESVKAASEVFSPVTGEISRVNEELTDNPERINESPYESWIVEIGGITDREEMMSTEEYEAFCAEEE